jgi:hypothetical protein
MPVLSSAAWVAHDVGLATAIGGSVFGKSAMHPALHELRDVEERDRVADTAWRRFGWINLAAHLAMAAPWYVGRRMLSGREAGSTARTLTLVKDVLVAASVATGVASLVLGRLLGRRVRRRNGDQRALPAADRDHALERTVATVGTANLAANLGVLGVTAVLAMQASESPRFTWTSRHLP